MLIKEAEFNGPRNLLTWSQEKVMLSVPLRTSSFPIRNFIRTSILRNPRPCSVATDRNIFSKVDTFIRGGVDFPHVIHAQNLLVSLHDSYGTGNWALDIVAATLIMKTLFSLPMMTWRINIFHAYGELRRNVFEKSNKAARKAILEYKVIAINPEDSVKGKRKIVKYNVKEETIKTNNHPLRGFIVIGAEALLYVTYFLSIKNLCLGLPDPSAWNVRCELQETHFLWLGDLTACDPYHLFPIIAFIAFLSSTEVRIVPLVQKTHNSNFSFQYMAQARKQDNIPNVLIFRLIKYAGRIFSIVFFYIVLQAPSVSTRSQLLI